MSSARPRLVAVSNSEQQRETLAIMLDVDFELIALASPFDPTGAEPPSAVVLSAAAVARDASPSPWHEPHLRQVLERWPDAALVLVDPPAPVAERLPDATVVSWTDPFALPAAVARATQGRGREPHLASLALSRALEAADVALRPYLESILLLAALVETARRPESVAIATRFLGERVLALVDQLPWVDGFAGARGEALASGTDGAADLGAALLAAVEERRSRAAARGIAFEWKMVEPCALPCAPEDAVTLARCLRAALLQLPAGTVSVDADARGLCCRHPALGDSAVPFTLTVAASLLRQVRARLTLAAGRLAVALEPEDELFH